MFLKTWISLIQSEAQLIKISHKRSFKMDKLTRKIEENGLNDDDVIRYVDNGNIKINYIPLQIDIDLPEELSELL